MIYCCTEHKWLVFPLRYSTEFYAGAAFFTQRTLAARKSKLLVGLFTAIGATAAFREKTRTASKRTAQKRHSAVTFYAAVRPVEPAIRCACEGMDTNSAKESVYLLVSNWTID